MEYEVQFENGKIEKLNVYTSALYSKIKAFLI